MNAKKLMTSTKEKNMVRKISHYTILSAFSTFGLLASQAVYAAEEASSGIPGWVWGLLVIAALIGITLLPKKWTDPNQAKKLEKPTPPQAPKAPAPAQQPAAKAVEPTPEVTPVAAPQVEVAPVAVEEVRQPEPVIEELDAVVEAKQLIAQQRLPQAVGVLNKGLQKDPARSDLMLMLLGVYLKQNDVDAFDAQLDQLKQLDDPIALIQADELNDQLQRPVVENKSISTESSETIDFASTTIKTPEPEAPQPSAFEDFDEGLAFTSEKPVVVEPEPEVAPTPDAESVSLGEAVEVTPIETEFSLDDIDFEPTPVETKETPVEEAPVEAAAKKPSDDFDFSEFDDFVVSAPSQNKVLDTTPVEPEPVIEEAKEVELPPVVEVAEIKAPAVETSQASELVDLEFDLDDSFSFDEEKTETSAKKEDWATDLADETFAVPSVPAEPAFKDPFATEVAPEPVVAAPVAPPKPVAPVVKDLATTLEEEFPFLQTADTFQTRLDLARNYIALGEIGSAKELLNEVIAQGAGTQQTEAKELIAKLAS